MKEVSSELEERRNEGISHFSEIGRVVPVLVHRHQSLVRLQCPHVVSNHVMSKVILRVRGHFGRWYAVDRALTMTSIAINIHGESSF